MHGRGHAGSLRHSVRVYALDSVRDGDDGSERPRWAVLYDRVPAAVEPMGGDEVADAEETRAQVKYRFLVRAGLEVSTQNRIGWRGRWFNVTGIQTDAQDVWMHIQGVEELKETL